MNWVRLIKLDVWNNSGLRSRRLEVVGTRKNGRARRRHASRPRVSPSRAPVFSCAHYFQAPATQAKSTVHKKIDVWTGPRRPLDLTLRVRESVRVRLWNFELISPQDTHPFMLLTSIYNQKHGNSVWKLVLELKLVLEVKSKGLNLQLLVTGFHSLLLSSPNPYSEKKNQYVVLYQEDYTDQRIWNAPQQRDKGASEVFSHN